MARVGSIQRRWNHKPPLAHTKLKGDKADDYVLYLPFNEGAGKTAYDLSGNGNEGALVGGVNWIDSSRGQVLEFDGVDGYVKIPPLNRPFSALTISAWVKLYALTTDHTMIFQTGPTNYYYLDFVNKLLTFRAINLTSDLTSGNTTVTTGVWHHVAVTYDGSNVRLYLDGVQDGIEASTGTILETTGQEYRIGVFRDGTLQLNGIIDDVRVSNHAISAEEIRQLYLDQYADLAPRRSVFVPRVVSAPTTTIGQATETDTAFPVTALKTRSIAQAMEADSAFQITGLKVHDIGIAVEIDSAFAVSASKVLSIGLSSEVDSAFTIASSAGIPIGQATETDTAFVIDSSKTMHLGLAVESDSAFVVTAEQAYLIGLAVETDSAFTPSWAKTVQLGLAIEYDSAYSVTYAVEVITTENYRGFMVNVGRMM